jgi:uncharacterized membrane protein YgcG
LKIYVLFFLKFLFFFLFFFLAKAEDFSQEIGFTDSTSNNQNNQIKSKSSSLNFKSKRKAHRKSAVITTADMWEEQQRLEQSSSNSMSLRRVNRRKSHELLRSKHLKLHSLSSRRNVLNIHNDKHYLFIQTSLGKLIQFDTSTTTAAAPSKKTYSPSNRKEVFTRNNSNKKNNRNSRFSAVLKGIRRSIVGRGSIFGLGNHDGDQQHIHEGEQTDRTPWFDSLWNNKIESWMKAVTSTPSIVMDDMVLQPLNEKEEGIALMRHICVMVSFSCLYETRKWEMAATNTCITNEDERDDEQETSGGSRRRSRTEATVEIDIEWCGRFLRIICLISTVLLLTGNEEDSNSGNSGNSGDNGDSGNSSNSGEGSGSGEGGEGGEGESKSGGGVVNDRSTLSDLYQHSKESPLLPNNDDLFDTISTLLYCMHHLIRRSSPTFIMASATSNAANAEKPTYWCDRLRTICKSNSIRHTLLTLSEEIDNADDFVSKQKSIYKVLYTIASIDSSLKAIEKRVSNIVNVEQARQRKEKEMETDRKQQEEDNIQSNLKTTQNELQEPIMNTIPPPPPLPSKMNGCIDFVKGMSTEEVVWWTKVLSESE